MPLTAKQSDARLFWESYGTGTGIVFVHEFGDNHRSWDPQVRFFARRHRCIVFAARGFPPSDVPPDVESYSQRQAALDIVAVMDAAQIERAHIVGCSMGGFAALHLGLMYPERMLSLVAAGVGYGAEKEHERYFQEVSFAVARNFRELGAAAFAPTYGSGASRVQFQNKDPLGWQRFIDRLAAHSDIGAANTMEGVQARRPSLYDFEEDFKRMTVPTLVVVGDEDDHCLQPGLYLKRTIAASGLLVVPKSGHAVNQEEPELFNREVSAFLEAVEAGQWLPRDSRARPDQIMRTAPDR